jgi:hypothetical protein
MLKIERNTSDGGYLVTKAGRVLAHVWEEDGLVVISAVDGRMIRERRGMRYVEIAAPVADVGIRYVVRVDGGPGWTKYLGRAAQTLRVPVGGPLPDLFMHPNDEGRMRGGLVGYRTLAAAQECATMFRQRPEYHPVEILRVRVGDDGRPIAGPEIIPPEPEPES